MSQSFGAIVDDWRPEHLWQKVEGEWVLVIQLQSEIDRLSDASSSSSSMANLLTICNSEPRDL